MYIIFFFLFFFSVPWKDLAVECLIILRSQQREVLGVSGSHLLATNGIRTSWLTGELNLKSRRTNSVYIVQVNDHQANGEKKNLYFLPKYSEPLTQSGPGADLRGYSQSLPGLGGSNASEVWGGPVSRDKEWQWGAWHNTTVCLWVSWRYVSLRWGRRLSGTCFFPRAWNGRRHTFRHRRAVDLEPTGGLRCEQFSAVFFLLQSKLTFFFLLWIILALTFPQRLYEY